MKYLLLILATIFLLGPAAFAATIDDLISKHQFYLDVVTKNARAADPDSSRQIADARQSLGETSAQIMQQCLAGDEQFERDLTARFDQESDFPKSFAAANGGVNDGHLAFLLPTSLPAANIPSL